MMLPTLCSVKTGLRGGMPKPVKDGRRHVRHCWEPSPAHGGAALGHGTRHVLTFRRFDVLFAILDSIKCSFDEAGVNGPLLKTGMCHNLAQKRERGFDRLDDEFA